MKDETAVAALAALAHADRLAAFRLLVKAGPNGLPSGEIADTLAIPPTRMSFHLATLERAGLLASRRDGRRILYAARYDEMRGLLAFLTEDCCNGRPEICGDIARLVSPCDQEVCS
ncbi:ArsR/SmtB family transcription factor [Consotaella aegiceratis]|uniref:ArsR/SmtB family transcription factor n=1 Tax=Consotaella aegiceratis TaxID=3097961 RepID=UPI002F41503C